MKHELLQLLPVWGPWLLAGAAFLSSMMVPVPTSFLLISAGALSGTGHDFLPLAALGAVAGAVLGDLAAFLLARRLSRRSAGQPSPQRGIMTRARGFMTRYGLWAIFLSRWLVTPLSPAINYVAGISGTPLARFLPVTLLGEAIWAVLHLSLGHVFGRQLRHSDRAELKAIAVAALLAILLLGLRWLWQRWQRGPI